MSDLDILQIHQSILEKFKDEENAIEQYETKLQDIVKSIKLPNLRHRTLKSLEDNKTKLEGKIKNIREKTTYNFYIMETTELLENYTKFLHSPVKVNFMGKQKTIDVNKDEIITKYCSIAKNYTETEIHFYKQIDNKIICLNELCKKTMPIDIIDNNYVCIGCGTMLGMVSSFSSYKDVERVNMSSKYTYDRKIHFRDCINQFQGKQNATIDQTVYDKLMEQFELHGLLHTGKDMHQRCADITREHIYLFLKETGFSKHYEDLVLIHYMMTGKRPDDISAFEPDLLDDFDVLTNAYDQKYRKNQTIDRKNFINTQYVLFQLLRRHKYPCKRQDFNILKTIDRKSFHDDVCKCLFEQLGWNFTALF
jgi:hypothetical protein